MIISQPDTRSPERKALDEAIANEPHEAVEEWPDDVPGKPIEFFHAQLRKPVAIAGIVENGLVRPLDPTQRLTELSRVIIVANV